MLSLFCLDGLGIHSVAIGSGQIHTHTPHLVQEMAGHFRWACPGLIDIRVLFEFVHLIILNYLSLSFLQEGCEDLD